MSKNFNNYVNIYEEFLMRLKDFGSSDREFKVTWGFRGEQLSETLYVHP